MRTVESEPLERIERLEERVRILEARMKNVMTMRDLVQECEECLAHPLPEEFAKI